MALTKIKIITSIVTAIKTILSKCFPRKKLKRTDAKIGQTWNGNYENCNFIIQNNILDEKKLKKLNNEQSK